MHDWQYNKARLELDFIDHLNYNETTVSSEDINAVYHDLDRYYDLNAGISGTINNITWEPFQYSLYDINGDKKIIFDFNDENPYDDFYELDDEKQAAREKRKRIYLKSK